MEIMAIYTKWNCKYHIVFAPKYGRRVFYYKKRRAIEKMMGMEREIQQKEKYVHILAEIQKRDVSSFMGNLKGKSNDTI